MQLSKKFTLVGAALLTATLFAGCNSTADGGLDAGAAPKVTIGIGGQTLLTYLPTTLAEQLGYYEEEGLDVDLQDLQGGSKALTALLGGSVNVASGYYEHTIQMQAKKQSITSFVQMGKSPALALVVAPGSTTKITSLEDLMGQSVGVTAPGSSTHTMLRFLLEEAGLNPDGVSVVAMGAGASAVAAMESGGVVAGVMLEPDISVLAKRTDSTTVTLADLRSPAGVEEHYDTDMWPSSSFYSQSDWLKENPETAKKLANALTKTLAYIADHTGAEIAAEMPESFSGGDLERYAALIEQLKPQLTEDGRNSEAGAEAVLDTQRIANAEVGDAEITLSDTYTNEFVGGK
ncbi:ABC transporter substrate-binding protein [Cryobacterium sp. PH31-O1]|uniref:ABC transporter substrate-binding protein n=1 Tax=Cryobacterium sp. PH31-O1 TaxID=3046306 RepID=UPI0024BB25CF|nr:ABC transporter substrate-binding protein [Cryobacterium sp. PH31-O1]MDJ0337361.1 ABC transporter substrate-binding protein [Cryobacterium sp. PH31-O1]